MKPRQAILVRVGIDQAYGGWNAPVDAESGQFFYVPIPESTRTRFYRGMGQRFREILAPFQAFSSVHELKGQPKMKWPEELNARYMHLDPDFEYLTYGNRGNSRGTRIANLKRDDLVVFYAGLKPIRPGPQRLIYAIIGLFVVDEVVPANEVARKRWIENAHTRKSTRGDDDVIVRAQPGVSGRLKRCLPIGEFRDKAYRVRRDLLRAWGGLSVNDGYIQRSAVPPMLSDAERFYRWFRRQKPRLSASNFGEDRAARRIRSAPPGAAAQTLSPSRCFSAPSRGSLHTSTYASAKRSHGDQIGAEERVFIVHLRQPRTNDPNEMRSDPFYEFGSFGCTRCHSRNLMNPKHEDSLNGARIGFAQGGKGEHRLVLLTPPVKMLKHRDRCEIRWAQEFMPFKFEAAPILASNTHRSQFPRLHKSLRGVRRNTPCAKFSSSFRSRCKPLTEEIAAELVANYEKHVNEAQPEDFSESYVDTMHVAPPCVDRARRNTYERLLREAGDRGPMNQKKCRPSRPRKRRKC